VEVFCAKCEVRSRKGRNFREEINRNLQNAKETSEEMAIISDDEKSVRNRYLAPRESCC